MQGVGEFEEYLSDISSRMSGVSYSAGQVSIYRSTYLFHLLPIVIIAIIISEPISMLLFPSPWNRYQSIFICGEKSPLFVYVPLWLPLEPSCSAFVGSAGIFGRVGETVTLTESDIDIRWKERSDQEVNTNYSYLLSFLPNQESSIIFHLSSFL